MRRSKRRRVMENIILTVVLLLIVGSVVLTVTMLWVFFNLSDEMGRHASALVVVPRSR